MMLLPPILLLTSRYKPACTWYGEAAGSVQFYVENHMWMWTTHYGFTEYL